MGDDACMACELSSGALPLPGGRICHRYGWIVEHCVGPLGVGTLIVKPERHVVHVADLSDTEASALGPLLRDAARVVTDLAAPEQVYVTLWSHMGGRPVHIHYVVQPITSELMARFGHGPRLQVSMFDAAEAPAETDVEVFAEKARRGFAELG